MMKDFPVRELRNVRRQHQWDIFETGVNGHLGACSSTGKPVEYDLKEGVSHGATDHRPLLAE